MIDLRLDELQRDLVDAVRATAAKEFTVTEGVEAMLQGSVDTNAERWQRVARLGWFSLGVPEAQGGLGLTSGDEVRLVTEVGRLAAPGPFIATLLAARLTASAGQQELADRLMAGVLRCGLMVDGLALDAGIGDLVLSVDADGANLATIQELDARPSVDPLLTLALVTDQEPVLRIDDISVLPRLRLLVGAYLAGLAAAAVEMSAEYAKVREQFGRPIGSFQAVKHRCADMVIRSYPVQAQLAAAACLLDDGAGALEAAEGLLLAVDAARRNAEDNVQNHGGIGFTAEHPAGVLVKRSMSVALLAGSLAQLATDVVTLPRPRPS